MTETYVSAVRAGTAAHFLVESAGAVAAQQPSITTISGSPPQGAVLTISGSNLHAETKQGWDNRFLRIPTSWSFEGASPAADGFVTSMSPARPYDTSVKLLGNQSMKFHTAITNPNCVQGIGQDYANVVVEDSASRNDAWVRFYVRYRRNSNWPNNFQKLVEFLNSGYYFQPDPRSAPSGGNPYAWNAFHDGANHNVSNPSGQFQNNRWYAVELHWQVSPRLYEAWVDGVKIYSGTPTSGASFQIFLFGVINACGTQSWDIEEWIDGLAIGHQRIYPSAVVEVGNSSNYASGTKKLQAVEYISDNQVSFRLDTSGLGAGPYYVWVRNNAQQLSQGYFLTGGQVSGPLAPSNLRIVP
jgi:hypothetical protein